MPVINAPDSLAPSNEILSPRAEIRFSWNSKINQTAFRLQYQVNGGTWSTISQTTGDRFYNMPANTITETTGVVNWRVQVKGAEDVYLAKDSDFVNVNGDWVYRGSALEVEIPTHINGKLVTSTNNMFSGAHAATPVTKVVLKHSNITYMGYMFSYSNATTLDLSSFNTSEVTSMSSMFRGSQATTLDLSGFNTSNVTDMYGMFDGSQATTLNLSSFDTSNVTDMGSMFLNSKATTGYARTQADADKFNASEYKPTGLNFVVKPYEEVYSDYASSSFMLGTLPVKKPRVFAPVGDYVETTRPLTFKWAYDPNPGEEQAGWEIKHSINGGVTSTTLSGTTETSKTISIADWGSQEAVWQIRVANQFNEWSEWTDWMRFQTIGSPPIPQITSVTNNNQPIINWTSSDQESFLIEILNMDGDLVYTSGKQVNRITRQHKAKEIIKNGKYLIKLTVYNIYDVPSPTVEYTHIINSAPTEIPTITLFDGKYNVTVKSDRLTGMVYRNDVYIGDLIEGKFDDFTVESGRNYIYKIANVDGQGVYSESIGKNAKIDFDVDTIALLSNPKDFVFLHVDIDNDPTDNNSHVLDGVAIQVHGQSEPILEFGEFETTTKSVKYLVDDYRPLKRLIDSRQDIIFRHRKGENFIGAITTVTYDRTIWGYSVAFTLTKTAVVR